jgi:ribosome-associated translation inhibitor RaiA/cold shock CspA family protein
MSMKLPMHVTFHGLNPSPSLELAAREKAQRLETFCSDIMACRVAVELRHKHKHQGRQFGVRVDVTVPGHELVANRSADEDAHVALREAFDDIRRQIEDTVRRRRGQVKEHALPLRGEVVRLNDEEGFGFIRTAAGDEYYFSRANLANLRFEQVSIGTEVQFIGELADEGRQAKRVSVGKHHSG